MKELITEIRTDMGMNQRQFAEALGISEAQVSRLESGERRPGRKTLAGLLVVAGAEYEGRLLDALKGNGKEE